MDAYVHQTPEEFKRKISIKAFEIHANYGDLTLFRLIKELENILREAVEVLQKTGYHPTAKIMEEFLGLTELADENSANLEDLKERIFAANRVLESRADTPQKKHEEALRIARELRLKFKTGKLFF